MVDLLRLFGFMALLFGGSMAIAYTLTAAGSRRRAKLDVAPGSSVRLIAPGGAYRCFFVRFDARGLVFAAPMDHDVYVPFHPGESIMVQAPQEAGVLCFRSCVVERNPFTHEFTLARPTAAKVVERRHEPRDGSYEGSEAELNGKKARMLNLSAMGARLIAPDGVKPGDWVQLSLPLGLGLVEGWALDARPSRLDGRPARDVRLRFAAPAPGLRAR